MAEKSSFFTSLNGDRKYKASDFAEYFKIFIGNGVFPNPSTNLQVIANGDMTLTISQGNAWINGYMYSNTDNLILTVENSDSSLKRIDRVVVKCDFINREIKTCIKKGVFSQNPTAPALTRDADAYELCIAEIEIGNGVIAIQQSKITDTRLNAEICGIVTQTVETIDTTTLFNQIEAYKREFEVQNEIWFDTNTNQLSTNFNTWFNSIKGILSEDVAGNLLNKINELEEVVNNLELVASNIKMEDGATVEDSIVKLQSQLNGQISRAKTILENLSSKVE